MSACSCSSRSLCEHHEPKAGTKAWRLNLEQRAAEHDEYAVKLLGDATSHLRSAHDLRARSAAGAARGCST